jgi:dTDP-6-deoxy-L-talose 4-dehydrogenase (NAD+)
MRIAVSGGNGFIGRHVLAELARHSFEVVAVVIPQLSIPSELSYVTIVRLDLRDATSNSFDLIGRPDVLIHLAWGGLPNYRSLHHYEEELPSQYRFLSELVRAGLTSIVVAGTCFEYGMQSGPLNEDMEARPSNPYGFAKDSLRRQLEYLKAVHPFALTWARLFYLYGEGQTENSLFPQLKKAVERGDAVFNMSGGDQLRDYQPVSEVARYLVELAVAQKDIGIINICSGKPISIRELVESWRKENGWAIDFNFGYYPYPDYEPMAFWGDRRKLDEILKSI